MSIEKYPDIFQELKAEVKSQGLSDRSPIRGSIEMFAILMSLILVNVLVFNWDLVSFDHIFSPILLGLFLTIILTRAVFVSHDLLHTQYFKSKSFSFKLTHPFSSLIISSSASWWDWKHNIVHHTFCNVPEKDTDIQAMDGAFAKDFQGTNKLMKKFKYLFFWSASLFMFPSFIIQSYSFAIKNKKWNEVFYMILHWPVIWGLPFYFMPLSDFLITFVTLQLVLSPWMFLGFITNHFGCEIFSKEEYDNLSWMELQMRTSRSLSSNKFVHWFYGGLNTQIEHHLFPKTPRFNLLKVQKITKDFAIKNNIFYLETTPIGAYIDINKALKEYK